MRIMIAVIAAMVISVLSIVIMSPSGDAGEANGAHLQASIRQTSQN
ncbi:hypothetical protein [Rhizobium sp. AC44/96]|nr:hypothetical protein [Rhizobium sp. AC44/96]